MTRSRGIQFRGPAVERVYRRTVAGPNGCIVWTGSPTTDGYSSVQIRTPDGGRKSTGGHRVTYEEMFGPIPDGLELDHLCRVRLCVNPLHLEPVTSKENVHRSPVAPAAVNARKTHCANGHPYDEENTYHWKGQRFCRACNRALTNRRYHAKRGRQ